MHSLKQALLCLLYTRWKCFAIISLIDCYLYFVRFHDQKSTSSLNTKTTPIFRQSSSLMIKINDHAEFDSPFLLRAYKSICWVMAGYTSGFFIFLLLWRLARSHCLIRYCRTYSVRTERKATISKLKKIEYFTDGRKSCFKLISPSLKILRNINSEILFFRVGSVKLSNCVLSSFFDPKDFISVTLRATHVLSVTFF